MFSWLAKIVDAAGRMFGNAEIVVHHPLEPVKSYMDVVVPGVLWRGSWPSKKMFVALKSKGIGVVVNLCDERTQDAQVLAAGLCPINIPIVDNVAPTQADVYRFTGFVNRERGLLPSVYVHCELGDGRTGCMIAAYRVLVQSWSQDAALKEAESYGLRMPVQKEFILGLR